MGRKTSVDMKSPSDASALQMFATRLEEKRSRYVAGDKFALFEALLLCGVYQAVIPEWAVDAMITLQDQIDLGQVTDAEVWGNMLGPPGRPAARGKRHVLQHRTGDVLMTLAKLRGEGHAFDNNCFDCAQERLREELGLEVPRRSIEETYKTNMVWLKKLPRGVPFSGGVGWGLVHLSQMKRTGRHLLTDETPATPEN